MTTIETRWERCRDDGEVGAAETGGMVFDARDAAEAVGERDEKLVASMVSQGVVEFLEVVQIEQPQR